MNNNYKIFDIIEIIEYLLNITFRKKRIPYSTIYEHFNVGIDDNDNEIPFEQKKSVGNFLTSLEKADRIIVDDLIFDDIIPIYSVILYRKQDNLPGIGFYDIFRNRNRKIYKEFTNDIIVQDAFKNKVMKQNIFDYSIELLKKDLEVRFPNQESIDSFINGIKVYKHEYLK